MDKIKFFFEHLYNKYNSEGYIKTDPIVFPHTIEGNLEYIAFTAAIFAYGNVKSIQKFLYSFFGEYGTDPFVVKTSSKDILYRFQDRHDIQEYISVMNRIYNDFGSIESMFINNSYNTCNSSSDSSSNVYDVDKLFNSAIKSFDEMHSKYLSTSSVGASRGLKFLFATPGKSASKRLHMFLRWMIRKDAVDFGIWTKFHPTQLYMPLDTHITKLCIKLGIFNKGERAISALAKANTFFRELNPKDPVKYDFCLTRLGIANKCIYEKSSICTSCSESTLCIFR